MIVNIVAVKTAVKILSNKLMFYYTIGLGILSKNCKVNIQQEKGTLNKLRFSKI
jgi:hypothetical protein